MPTSIAQGSNFSISLPMDILIIKQKLQADLRKNQLELLEIKTVTIKMKNCVFGVNSIKTKIKKEWTRR